MEVAGKVISQEKAGEDVALILYANSIVEPAGELFLLQLNGCDVAIPSEMTFFFQPPLQLDG